MVSGSVIYLRDEDPQKSKVPCDIMVSGSMIDWRNEVLQPDRAEEEFLKESKANLPLAILKPSVSSLEERKKTFYLHSKDDYEIGSREQLIDYIKQVLKIYNWGHDAT